jgi:hypothetical protein
LSGWRKLFPAAPPGLDRPARAADDFHPDDFEIMEMNIATLVKGWL